MEKLGRKIIGGIGGEETLDERRMRSYEGSIWPNLTPFERGVIELLFQKDKK